MYKLMSESDFRVSEKPGLGMLATFVPNKSLPVYNWFYYKEGFSRDLVLMLMSEFGICPGKIVADTFCGSGTTNLACRQSGVDSFGFDVLPLSVFVSRVKTRDYDTEMLKKSVKDLLRQKFRRPANIQNRVSKLAKKSFSIYVLEDIIFFRDAILRMESCAERDFLMLGLMNAASKCSYAVKDGGAIKIRKKGVPPLREMMKRQLHRMIKDLQCFETMPCKTCIEYGDARMLDIENETMDAIITSPPYLNKIEYSGIYRIEEELFMPREEIPGIRSFIGSVEADYDSKVSEKTGMDIPVSAEPYFQDMDKCIGEMFRICKPGARAAVVVGDGFAENQAVDSAEILCKLAEIAGFRVNEIVVVNRRIATTPGRRKVGTLKESILLWEK